MKRIVGATLLAAALTASSAFGVAAAGRGAVLEPAATAYRNCTELNRHYPHGVGKRHAVDHVSGNSTPVTNFTRNNALYAANQGRDRDNDNIACEKH